MHAPPSPATDRPSSGETALLTVDLAALTDNWRLLAKRGAPAECAAVIKANAYGLGLEPVMRALLGAGCRTFFVATAREGERARAVSSEAVVYVLDGLAPGAMQRLMWAKLRPVLNSLAEIDEWSDAGAAALHFDTGMNRMGLPPADAGAAAERFSAQGAAPTLVMSHFVSAQWREIPATSPRSTPSPRYARVFRVFPPRCAILRAFFWVKRRISTSRAPATQYTAEIRRRASPIRCAAWRG